MSDQSKPALTSLIKEARLKGLWLYAYYQDLWFSPDELEQANKEGRFWSESFIIRDPRELIDKLEQEVLSIRTKLKKVKEQL